MLYLKGLGLLSKQIYQYRMAYVSTYYEVELAIHPWTVHQKSCASAENRNEMETVQRI